MPPSPTTTSYAVLGLLSVRSWTTYELVEQVRRSLNWFWPRAERRLYEEPKTLAEQGWATVEERFTGKRRSLDYSITDEGRAALRRWLAEPPAPRSGEFEGMVKVFFADSGDLSALRETLVEIEEEATERARELGALAEADLPFPERAHLSAITLRLGLEQELVVRRWARWARQQVEEWADTRDPATWDATAALAEVARLARDETGDETGAPGTA